MSSEYTIPPVRLPEEPYTNAQFECYTERAEDYLLAVKQCVTSGEPGVQACINTAHSNYLAQLGVCDVL